MQYLPLLSVIIPLIFAVLLVFCRSAQPKLQKILVICGSLLPFMTVMAMFPSLKEGGIAGTGNAAVIFPLSFSFTADPLSIFIAAIFSVCGLIATIYSFGYINHSHAQIRYYIFMLVFQASMLGVVLSGSLLVLFIFFELMTVSAYLLVIHEEDETAMVAGKKFLYMSLAAGLFIFLGLSITYSLAGRLDFISGGYIGASPLAAVALFAFLVGFGVKAGMFPLHIWLPDAHPAAPAPVSALLSGCSIKTGIYGIIRVMHYIYELEAVRAAKLDQVLLVLAVATILLGSALALRQDHLKRRLAYSSVAQIGYVLLGISLLTERAMFGALFHIFSHAVMKSALFLCAGAIITQTGKKYISQLAGIGYQMPVVMLSFTLASITMVGIPPFNAFISKWHLAVASLETGRMALVVVLIVSSLLNALYYFPIVINAFFVKTTKSEGKKSFICDELPAGMIWTTALLAVLCVVFAFIQPNWPVIMAGRIAASIF